MEIYLAWFRHDGQDYSELLGVYQNPETAWKRCVDEWQKLIDSTYPVDMPQDRFHSHFDSICVTTEIVRT